MQYQISNDSIAAVVYIQLQQGQQVRLQRGSVVSYTPYIQIEGKTNGGMFSAIGKSLVSGESIFKTIATSQAPNQVLTIAPSTLGSIKIIPVDMQNQWRINDTAFLACDVTVDYNMKRQSVGKAFFGGTGGLYVMETFGQGSLMMNGFGEILEVSLDGSSEYVVDNEHVLAWSSNLEYEIGVASGTFGFKSGEGLVNRFRGVGKVYIQTRSLGTFARIVARLIPSK